MIHLREIWKEDVSSSVHLIMYVVVCIRGEYDFSNSQWRHVSERVKNLIEKLLVVDADERLTSREAFEHPWIQKKRVMQASSPSSNKMKDIFLSIDKYVVVFEPRGARI